MKIPEQGDVPWWDDTNFKTAFDLSNRRGRNPVDIAISGTLGTRNIGISRKSLENAANAGSSNFQLSVPVVRLPGRGIDLVLDLHYNSLLWHKAGDDIGYNIDSDWPAPGWSLGFGKLFVSGLAYGLDTECMLYDANGTRHNIVGTSTRDSEGLMTFNGHTTDGSLIDCTYTRKLLNVISAQVKYPNGTVVDFSSGYPVIYPIRITDKNGNYITIAYRKDGEPRIEWITDTVRTIIDFPPVTLQFHYDTNNLLTAITGPGLNEYLFNWDKVPGDDNGRLIEFLEKKYGIDWAKTAKIEKSVDGKTIKVSTEKNYLSLEHDITRVYLKIDDGRTDEFIAQMEDGKLNIYLNGRIRTLIRLHYKNLTLRPAFAGNIKPLMQTDKPNVIDAIYFPDTATGYWFGDPDSYSSYGMIAKVREQRGMVFKATSLEEKGTIINPGTMTREKFYKYPLQPDSMLTDAPTYTEMTEKWESMDTPPPAVTTYKVQRNASSLLTEVTYPNGTRNVQQSYIKQPGEPDYWLNGLVFRIEAYDTDNKLLQTVRLEWQYGAYESPLLLWKQIYDELNQTKQSTYTRFSYGSYNRVTEVSEYDYGSVNLLRRVHTDYETDPIYIDRHIFNLPKIVQIYAGNETDPISCTEYAYDGHPMVDTPGLVFGHSDPGTDRRGNVTELKTYTDASHRNGAIIRKYFYDITGNLIKTSTPLCEKSYKYTRETAYAYPVEQTRGSADPSSPARITNKATYDINTGLVLTTEDADGRTTNMTYFTSQRPNTVKLPMGGSIAYSYDDAALKIMETVKDNQNNIVGQSIKLLNGLGLVRREEVLAEGNEWNIIETKYDVMGRIWKQTQPFRNDQVQQWSETFYDALGRIIRVRAPDGSEQRSYYNEPTRPSSASSLPGQTIRVVDAWGRERWTRTNAIGQLVEVIEPNPEGSGSVFDEGSLVTNYYYNLLDKLVRVIKGVQKREFRYDSWVG